MKSKKQTQNKVTLTENIENTPFSIVTNDENKMLITFGKLVISDRTFDNIEAAKTWLELNHWNVTLNLIAGYDFIKNKLNAKIK